MATDAPAILVVDDDAKVRAAVQKCLEDEGYTTKTAADGASALAQLEAGSIDLVLLDVGLPDTDGFHVCEQIREQSGRDGVPVIMLTAATSTANIIRGLSVGADDYVTKPFSFGELLARIQAVLRRADMGRPMETGRLDVDEWLQIDCDEQAALVGGKKARLRPTEFRLLMYLFQHAGRTVSHEAILQHVWGPEYGTETNYVHLYVTYLRQKIEPEPSRPRYILTKRSLGYSFRAPARQEQGADSSPARPQ